MRRPTGLLRQLDCLWDYFVSGGGGSGGVGPQGPPGPKGDKGDTGEPGADGSPGADGQAGPTGPKGDTGDQGPVGPTGNDGNDGSDGAPGADGPSAYEVAVANGFAGTIAQWLASLVGAKGDKGDRGDTGPAGSDGAAGPAGSDGNDGSPGQSAYQVAVSQGYSGTVTEWLASLVGPKGDTGNTGPAGADGVRTGTTVFGYAVGAGGTAAQSGNKSNAVTLNKLTGEITLTSAALAAGAIVSFTLNNNTIAAGDQIVCTHHATGTFGAYGINGRVTGAGVAVISVRNNSAASLSEAIVIKFSVIKSASA